MAATPNSGNDELFDRPTGAPEGEAERFCVDVDGYEGPLDLLLDLARRQKVDLQKISVLALVEQYLTFIEVARGLRLELAADYLVMAAWLAYLKSRLLLPRLKDDMEPEAGELAAALAERLRRLEVIRAAAAALEARPRIGRDLHLRGMPDTGLLDGGAPPLWSATIYDLLSAYARQRQKHARAHLTVHKRHVWSLVEARAALQRIAGQAVDWAVLDGFLLTYCTTPEMARTVRASAFSVALEMVKEGQLAMRQDAAFGPLWVKHRPEAKAGPVRGAH
jgi:segregation and condensation protein A